MRPVSRREVVAHAGGELGVRVEPRAGRRAPERDLAEPRHRVLDPRDALTDLRRVPGELLAERHRDRVHEVRPAGLHDVVELGGLPLERLGEQRERGQQVARRSLRARRGAPRTGRRRSRTGPCSRGRSDARPRRRASAMTSFAFMFELVPEPVWKTSIGNWSSNSPSAMRSPAAAMRSARSRSSSSRSAFARAAAALMRPSQRATGTGIGSPETGKFATALSVSPPQSAFFSTASVTRGECSSGASDCSRERRSRSQRRRRSGSQPGRTSTRRRTAFRRGRRHEALDAALADWRGGRTSWEHWGIPGEECSRVVRAARRRAGRVGCDRPERVEHGRRRGRRDPGRCSRAGARRRVHVAPLPVPRAGAPRSHGPARARRESSLDEIDRTSTSSRSARCRWRRARSPISTGSPRRGRSRRHDGRRRDAGDRLAAARREPLRRGRRARLQVDDVAARDRVHGDPSRSPRRTSTPRGGRVVRGRGSAPDVLRPAPPTRGRAPGGSTRLRPGSCGSRPRRRSP